MLILDVDRWSHVDKVAMFYHVDDFESIQLAIFESIQIWECALNRVTMEPIQNPKLNICHLHGLGATYPKHVFLLIPMCK